MEARTFLLAAVLAAGTTASAQLRTDSCGRVAAGGFAADPATKLSVGNTAWHGSGYCVGTHASTPSTSLYNIGAEGVALPASPGGTGHSFGIRGIAGSGSSGRNYGVSGALLDSLSGAGVAGSDGMSPEVAAGGMYAGLFFGDAAATCTAAARLVNEHDAPSTQADTISGTPSGLLYPIRSYTKVYPAGSNGTGGSAMPRGTSRLGGTGALRDSVTPTSEYHYCVVMDSGVPPGLVTEDAQGREVANYTELVPLMAGMAWDTIRLFLGWNTRRVLSGEMSPQEAAELAGWTPDDAATLLAVAVAREEISGTMIAPTPNASGITLMFFDESGALLSQRTQTDSERLSGNIGQCPQGAAYCAIVADGAEVQTVRVAR